MPVRKFQGCADQRLCLLLGLDVPVTLMTRKLARIQRMECIEVSPKMAAQSCSVPMQILKQSNSGSFPSKKRDYDGDEVLPRRK